MPGNETRLRLAGQEKGSGEASRTSELAPERPHSEPLFLRLARLLDPSELEVAILREMRARVPQATAMISLDPTAARPSRSLDAHGIRRWKESERPVRSMAVVLTDQGESHGWIAFLDNAALRPHKAVAVAQLLELAAAAAIPARNARRHAAALELTLRDPLTGLYNRRAFDTLLEREEQRARRNSSALALIAIDVDRFKELNDSFGHAVGDRALITLGRVLIDAVRRSDVVARVGGDEFAIILPETSTSGANRIAARIRRLLSERPVEVAAEQAGLVVSISCGIAELNRTNGDAESMARDADAALYQAKRAGRNRVLQHARN